MSSSPNYHHRLNVIIAQMSSSLKCHHRPNVIAQIASSPKFAQGLFMTDLVVLKLDPKKTTKKKKKKKKQQQQVIQEPWTLNPDQHQKERWRTYWLRATIHSKASTGKESVCASGSILTQELLLGHYWRIQGEWFMVPILMSYHLPFCCLQYPLSLITSLGGDNWAIMGVFCYVSFYSKIWNNYIWLWYCEIIIKGLEDLSTSRGIPSGNDWTCLRNRPILLLI